jgi:hypothetical protein
MSQNNIAEPQGLVTASCLMDELGVKPGFVLQAEEHRNDRSTSTAGLNSFVIVKTH